jgi:tape measure domain-containing protein
VAYTAEIQIAVKGAKDLRTFQAELDKSSKAVDRLSRDIQTLSEGGIPRSINNLNRLVAEAAESFNKVALGTQEAATTARNYYQANKTLNNSLRERLKLLNDIQNAERGAVLANIKASQAARNASNFGAFSAGIEGDIATQKAIRRNQQKRAQADAATETALQITKLTERQQEFTVKTDEAAAAAHRQTAEFIRLQRIAKQVAALNAVTPPAQLLLAAAAPGAPAMSGGARRRITGQVERLGGLRTKDEAGATLRLAQATDVLAKSTNKIDPQYNRFLPDTQLLNATGRGIQRLTTDQEAFNQSIASGVRFTSKFNQEQERLRRLGIGTPASNRMPGTTAVTGGFFPTEGPMNLMTGGRRQSMLPGTQAARSASLLGGIGGRLPGAISGGIIGGAFPLLFGQGGGAAAGGLVGGLAGGLVGPGGSFAGSLLGTLLGDIASQGQKIKQLGTDIGFSAQQANVLADGFKKANTDIEKFTAVVQNIRGLGLELEDQAELIKLTTSLTEKYGGQFDKVGSAITSALESGKVSQSTLNQLTSQGVTIQQALADKLGVSKDQLLEMAKKGKIDIQDLVDTLVDMGNKGVEATKKPASGMEQLGKAAQGLGTAIGDLGAAIMKALKPALDWLAGALAGIIGLATRAINAMANMLSGGTAETALANARARERLAAEGGPSIGTRYVAQKYQPRLEELQKEEQAKIVKPDSKIKPIDVSSLGRAPGSGGGGTDKAAQAAAREAARVLEVLRDQRLITIELERQSDYSKKIFAAELAKDPILARRLQGEQQLEEIAIETAGKLDKEVNMKAKLAILGAQEAKAALAYQETAQAVALIEQQRKENTQNVITSLEYEKKLKSAVTEAERERLRIQYEMAELAKDPTISKDRLAEIEALKKQIAAPETAGEIIEKRIGALQDELLKLTNIGNIAVTVADSIGAAFSQAFQGIISGTMTAQEALASFFQSVGDAFIQMASEIIAKQLTMIILQTILKALGGGGGTSPFAGGAATGGETNAFAYAAGAPQFRADGGSVRASTPYLVGERGPELFVPGTSGGVMSNSDLRASMGAAPGSSGGPVLNMSFETSTINGVEYVSRDQLEAAMAQTRRQAARDGAQRGMSMTLDRLQQSPSTRKRVGF